MTVATEPRLGDLPAATGLDDLSLLTALAHRLDGPLGVTSGLDEVLRALERERTLDPAVLLLFDRGHQQLVIDRAPSLSQTQRKRGRYALGEGVVGQVARDGTIAALPSLAGAPAFLDRIGRRAGRDWSDYGFLAVPVQYGEELVGVLACDRRPECKGRPLSEDLALLEIAARMIAPSAAARQARLGKGTEDQSHPRILGRSKAIRGVMDAVRTVAQAEATVLILGESGTGKELVADAIHRASRRAEGPFVRVNCAALPEGVLESELFGHEQGAFTGAMRQRIGRFEAAHGGTIFLDEIGDLPAPTQVALLRILQERTLQRVGGNAEVDIDVRVIAATHRDLPQAIADGNFREDLYYRLDVFPIRTPALRDRRTDIPLLADHFVERYSRASAKNVRRISSRAIDMLMAYHWPGNVRELENCMERAVLLCEDDVIHGRHLPPTLQIADSNEGPTKGSLESTLLAVERDLIDDALKVARGNMAEAARQLGLTERKMGLRVRKHGIEPRRHRRPKS
ncbi:MAG: sigma 54-interacting transcriptional regulator [Myxococcota bacterium]